MHNLNITTENNYFYIPLLIHTCIDAKQIYNTLKSNGILIIRGVDKLDCWELKKLFKRGITTITTIFLSFFSIF